MHTSHCSNGMWPCAAVLITLLSITTGPAHAAEDPIVPYHVDSRHMVDEKGNPGRFWGVNLVAFYPDKTTAEGVAQALASLQINLVRPHHLLRPSADWVRKAAPIVALNKYKTDSREADPDAWDRFDYLNSQLRQHGIYLSLSLHFSRSYLPGDVDILTTTAEDRTQWMEAMKELNTWGWQKSSDVKKILPVIDERAAMLYEEFAKNLLTHVNPYTKRAYGNDPQVLTLEVVNESSAEYALICGNKFPAYWDAKLQGKWRDFAKTKGIADAGDLYGVKGQTKLEIRSQFFRKLDEDYFLRMKKVVRSTGCKTAITYSNLWRGENNLAMHAANADFIENHEYGDPLVVRSVDDFTQPLARTALADKPFFVGELNVSESSEAQKRQGAVRSMLPLATAAYGSLQDWSGVEWFAWSHGDSFIGRDGWAASEARQLSIGTMVTDAAQIDHLRTTGIIFRRHLIAPSRQPIIVTVDDGFTAGNYNQLMNGQIWIKPGWQSIHAVYKSIATSKNSTVNKDAPWLQPVPEGPLQSDTSQIIKDLARRQLTIAAPAVEAFSGYLDAAPPAALRHLFVDEKEGFSTVIVVADDDQPLEQSRRLIISRTSLGSDEQEIRHLPVRLVGLKTPEKNQAWFIRMTRPREVAAALRDYAAMEFRKVDVSANNALLLPTGTWTECELHLRQP